MQRYNDVSRKSKSKCVYLRGATWPYSRLLSWGVVAILFLTVSACGSLGTGSESISSRIVHLPTLTRTPLPSLTPTVMAIAAAAAIAAELSAPAPNAGPVEIAVGPEAATATSSPGLTVPAAPADVTGSSQAAGATDTTAVSPPHAQTDAPTVDPGVDPNPLLPPGTHTSIVTEVPSSTPTETLPTSTPTPTATDTPTSTPAPTDTPTATPLPEGWVFSGVQDYPDQEEGGLVLYGQVINNTETSQELLSITGTFYDGPGQVIAGNDDTFAFWPAYVVPPGGSMPFELIADGIDHAANFDLSVEAEPSSDTVQHDFEFTDLNQWTEDDVYCLEGKVQNLGAGMEDYLIIAAVLYDDQDNVVKFGDYQEFGHIGLAGDTSSDFEICVVLPNQAIDRYELQGWGQ